MMKAWRSRLGSAFLIAALMVVVDEAVKEQYLFDFTDLTGFSVTHEKVFLILLTAGLLLGWRR